MVFEMMRRPTAFGPWHAAPFEDAISESTVPWLRLTRQDSDAQRAITRGNAARIPFLLGPELDDVTWPHRRLWDVRPALDLAVDPAGDQLLELCRRTDRVLVTPDASFLDDWVYPPGHCPGVIVIDAAWRDRLDDFLVTIVGLLGPVPALYRHVKAHGTSSGELIIAAPEGRGRRVRRRFLLDADGLPLLSELAAVEQRAAAMH